MIIQQLLTSKSTHINLDIGSTPGVRILPGI